MEYVVGAVLVVAFVGLYGLWVWCLADLARGDHWFGFAFSLLLPVAAPFFAGLLTNKEERSSAKYLLLYWCVGAAVISVIYLTSIREIFPLVVVIGLPAFVIGMLRKRQANLEQE